MTDYLSLAARVGIGALMCIGVVLTLPGLLLIHLADIFDEEMRLREISRALAADDAK